MGLIGIANDPSLKDPPFNTYCLILTLPSINVWWFVVFQPALFKSDALERSLRTGGRRALGREKPDNHKCVHYYCCFRGNNCSNTCPLCRLINVLPFMFMPGCLYRSVSEAARRLGGQAARQPEGWSRHLIDHMHVFKSTSVHLISLVPDLIPSEDKAFAMPNRKVTYLPSLHIYVYIDIYTHNIYIYIYI